MQSKTWPVIVQVILQQGLQQQLRAAPRKYQLDLEIAKKLNFSKLPQNEALRALVTENIVLSLLNRKLFFYDFFLFDPPNQPKSIENERHIQRLGN